MLAKGFFLPSLQNVAKGQHFQDLRAGNAAQVRKFKNGNAFNISDFQNFMNHAWSSLSWFV